MPFTPGLDEATLIAHKALLVANIGELDTRLQASGVALPAGSAEAGSVITGDPAKINQNYKFRICVIGGGRDGTRAMEVNWKAPAPTIRPSCFEHRIYTKVRLYLNPLTFSMTDDEEQAEVREFAISRFCDWARGYVYETNAGTAMTLTSTEYRPTGDTIVGQKIDSIDKGTYEKSFGNSQLCHGAEIILSALIQ